LNRGGRPSEWESEPLRRAWAEGVGEANPLPLRFAFIHPSAWNWNPANFAFWAFSEIQMPFLRVFTELPRRSQAV
jgi:hypothetical protein